MFGIGLTLLIDGVGDDERRPRRTGSGRRHWH
jgi:hypothetical protein